MKRKIFENGVRRNRAGVGEDIIHAIETTGAMRVKIDVRDHCAQEFQNNVGAMVSIITCDKATNADKVRALDLLGKYGGLQQVEAITSAPHRARNIAEDLTPEILAMINQHLGR